MPGAASWRQCNHVHIHSLTGTALAVSTVPAVSSTVHDSRHAAVAAYLQIIRHLVRRPAHTCVWSGAALRQGAAPYEPLVRLRRVKTLRPQLRTLFRCLDMVLPLHQPTDGHCRLELRHQLWSHSSSLLQLSSSVWASVSAAAASARIQRRPPLNAPQPGNFLGTTVVVSCTEMSGVSAV